MTCNHTCLIALASQYFTPRWLQNCSSHTVAAFAQVQTTHMMHIHSFENLLTIQFSLCQRVHAAQRSAITKFGEKPFASVDFEQQENLV